MSLLASSLATAELPQHVLVVERVSHARRFEPHLCLVSVLCVDSDRTSVSFDTRAIEQPDSRSAC